jgi:hypothetical protein
MTLFCINSENASEFERTRPFELQTTLLHMFFTAEGKSQFLYRVRYRLGYGRIDALAEFTKSFHTARVYERSFRVSAENVNDFMEYASVRNYGVAKMYSVNGAATIDVLGFKNSEDILMFALACPVAEMLPE